MYEYWEVDDAPGLLLRTQQGHRGFQLKLTTDGWELYNNLKRFHERAEMISSEEAAQMADAINPGAAKDIRDGKGPYDE